MEIGKGSSIFCVDLTWNDPYTELRASSSRNCLSRSYRLGSAIKVPTFRVSLEENMKLTVT